MTDFRNPKENTAVILLAAGSASRMRGGDKLLEEVDGEPLLRRLTRQSRAVSDLVLVCLRVTDEARRSVLDGLNCHIVSVSDAADGMAHSLRAGIAQVPETTSGAMIIPADMPELTEADLRKMACGHADQPDAILRATSQDNQPGHPVLFPSTMYQELRQLSGDVGARDILKRHSAAMRFIKLPDNHARTDLDTPEAWRDWRQSRRK